MGKANGVEKKEKSPLKRVIILTAVLLLAGGGILGWLIFGGNNGPGGKGKISAEASGELIYGMEIFVVNLNDSEGKRYLKTKLNLEYSGAELTDELKLRQPQLRDMILLLLSGKTAEEIQGTEGKITLRRELIMRINQALQKGKIRTLYFTEFVIQ
ncbi:MAG: flagellar basal body-associated FliL family protein [Pseudomonadota bacterium]